jgi:flagellar protein FlbD
MVLITRLDGKEIFLNDEQILYLERTPDTVIVTASGLRLLCREPVEEIVERIVAFRRRVLAGPIERPPEED